MIINENGYNRIQVNETTNQAADGTIISRSIMINIREESVSEAWKLYSELKKKLEDKEPKKKAKKKKKEETPETPICRKCGAPMVLRRNNKEGNYFWGCSAFPICNGTRQYQEKKEIPADEDLAVIEM